MKIGFFDSGIGGITVLSDAVNFLKPAEFIYYADSKNVPYGVKPKEEVKNLVFNSVDFLISKGIDALVVACNTATSVAIKDIREKYRIPVIGMEPAVKPAVINTSKKKRVLVTATELTLKEKKYNQLVKKVDKNHRVDSLPLGGLVDYVEREVFNKKKINNYLEKKFKEINLDLYETVVLGCTHFIFYKDLLKDFFPGHIELIDGNMGTVKHLKDVLIEENLYRSDIERSKIKFYSSGNNIEDEIKFEKLLVKYRSEK